MSTVRLRSLNDPPENKENNDAAAPVDDAAAPLVADDTIPESWRSLSEKTPAPVRIVPHAAARSGAPAAAGDAAHPRRRIALRVLLAVLAVAVVVEGAIIAQLVTARAPSAVPVAAPVAVTIGSATPGDPVVIDGRQVGVTPYVVNVEPSMREIRVVGGSTPASVEPAPPPVKPEPSETLAATAPRSGGLKLQAAIDIQVLEGERVLGSSAEGPVVTSAGPHVFDFVNSEFGYRERRRVEIKAGQIISLTIVPPNGRLNINAVPWATVTIDGKDAGDTPLANLPLSVGSHDLVFHHPQFGERAQRVVVKADTLTRVSVTMNR
jgi:hypothetical protein